MSKEVHIIIIQDEHQTAAEARLEVLATVDGVGYYESLEALRGVLWNYGSRKKLTEEQQVIVEDIKKRCAKHFRGLVS